MSRIVRNLSAFGVAATLSLGALGPLTAQGDVDAARWPGRRVVTLVNLRRAEAGLRPVRLHADVHVAARKHSADQARMHRMTHTGSDGSDAGQRISREGYSWSAWGENVAVGYGTPRAVMRAWMHSPGHRANILSRRFRHIGVGVRRSGDGPIYWTMDLARPG